MCFVYDEYCDLYFETIRKSRKLHLCCACSGDIRNGEQYQQTESLMNGEWERVNLCNTCTQNRIKIHFHEIDEGCGEGESWCTPEEIGPWIREREAHEDLPFEKSTRHVDLKQLEAAVRAERQLRRDNERERRERIRAELLCKPQN